jgi:hypothetical protein
MHQDNPEFCPLAGGGTDGICAGQSVVPHQLEAAFL